MSVQATKLAAEHAAVKPAIFGAEHAAEWTAIVSADWATEHVSCHDRLCQVCVSVAAWIVTVFLL